MTVPGIAYRGVYLILAYLFGRTVIGLAANALTMAALGLGLVSEPDGLRLLAIGGQAVSTLGALALLLVVVLWAIPRRDPPNLVVLLVLLVAYLAAPAASTFLRAFENRILLERELDLARVWIETRVYAEFAAGMAERLALVGVAVYAFVRARQLAQPEAG